MILRSYSDEAIVLARKSFGEADRIISVFSKHHGRLSLMAKGVRRPVSRKRGSLEVFSYIKFAAVKGKNLDIMTEAEIIDSFSLVRRDLKKVTVAYFFMEAVGRTTRENEHHQELFNLLLEYLAKLEKETALKSLRLDFIHQLLISLGFWPKGRPLINPDAQLEQIIERNLSSVRVGKKLNN